LAQVAELMRPIGVMIFGPAPIRAPESRLANNGPDA
jgi:hypothetical protein